MTQGNYNYRTNPLFLRNNFRKTGKYGIPIIPKSEYTDDDFQNLRLIGFDKVRSDKGGHANRIVHFFLYDYKFERVWNEPESDIELLQAYRAVLTPDFSMYTQMPDAMLLYNVFRNRWCGAYFASQGLRVIPTVNWGTESSFDFCFEGIKKGSAVAVSTYMVQAKDGREPQTEFFMAGYNEMIRRIEPETIICYHEPFPEMRGNIIYVNYELSSWQHMEDDIKTETKQADYTVKERRDTDFRAYMIPACASGAMDKNDVYRIGYQYAEKGSGSAYGGDWKPSKPEDKRFFGKPGEIKKTDMGRQGVFETKIGANGKAEKERHWTNHGHPKYHSIPHDEIIKYNPDGSPNWDESIQINYFDGNIPEFKSFMEVRKVFDDRFYTYENLKKAGCLEPRHYERLAFKSISEFQKIMRSHAEVVFVYNQRVYSLTYIPGKIVFSETYYEGDNDLFDTSEEVLNQVLDGNKLREIITEIKVVERTL